MAQESIDNNKLAREKRELARRARRLAQTLVVDADRTTLVQFAAQLEKEAEVLERQQQVQQQQVQQQQSAEASVEPGAKPSE